MRTLSAALIAAAQTQGSVPDLKLELADMWPHFATVATATQSGPVAATIAPDGSVVAAYVSTGVPNTVYVLRVTDPTNAGQWAGWTVLSTDGRNQAGVCLCVAGSTIRVLWQSSASTAVLAADSTNSGQSWSPPTGLFDPGHPLYGIAADGDLNLVLVAYDTGTLMVRLAAWRVSGTWSHVDWTNGDLNAVVGIAAGRNVNGSYGVVLALQGVSGEAYSIASCMYTFGGSPVWTDLAPIVAVDTSVGVTVRAPHLAQFDGMYRLAYGIADTGATSGIVYNRVARSSSADFVHWQAGLEDVGSGGGWLSGAAWVKHSAGQLLVGAEAARLAPAYNPSVSYRDLTPDLVKLDLIEREGEPARLVATLDNSSNVYSTLGALVSNAQLLLSQGFVGAGLVPTHLLYLDEWTFVRAVDEAQVVLVAHDRLRFLGRQTRYPLLYSNRDIAYILQDLAILAGFDAVQVDGSSQFAQQIALFQVPAGERYLTALARLLAAYDGTAPVRTVPGGTGTAFGAVDVLDVAGKSPAQSAIWTYTSEPEYLHLARSGGRANHVVVYGPQQTTTAVAEAWDWADMAATGQERFALVIERFATSTGAAQLAASLALARETRLATRAALAVGPHPGLELLDAIAVTDPELGSVTVRIGGQHLTYYPLEAVHELVLACEGL